jgi:CRISPR/Cas system-associated endonuclease/helicase Cas3
MGMAQNIGGAFKTHRKIMLRHLSPLSPLRQAQGRLPRWGGDAGPSPQRGKLEGRRRHTKIMAVCS